MILLTPIANNSSTGHISSLPIHISAMKVSFTITGDVVAISDDVNPTLLTAEATSNKTCETL